MSPLKSEMAFEDLLEEVGAFGKYQKRLIVFFLAPSAAFLPWFSMNIFLMIYTPDHWCYVPEVANSNLSLDVQRSIIAPSDNSTCFMYDLNYSELNLTESFKVDNSTPMVPCNNGWQYDKMYFRETAASKWNMVCEDRHLSSLIVTLANVGSIIGTPIYGTLSDKIGRKPVFFIVILVTAVTAITSVLMESFTAFLVLRTINGSLMPSVFQLPYIILLELVGPEMRTRMNGVANAGWTVGLCVLPLVAHAAKHWVPFALATSAVSVLMFLYWRFLPESPRWLVSCEKYAEATTVMTRIADTNGRPQDPADLRIKIQRLGERIKKEKDMKAVNNSVLDLIRYPNLRKKFIVISFCWVANMFAYYGLQMNVEHLGGNPFSTFFFLAAIEVPGLVFAWLFMERIGRRWCSVFTLALTGTACLVAGLLPPELQGACVWLSLVGKFGSSASFMAVYQQSSELYPTTVRAIGMGMSGTFAGLANIVVPYVVFLAVVSKSIPFLIIGCVCVVAAFSATLLPETLDEILPQTVQDAEDFGKDHRFWSCAKGKRRKLPTNDKKERSMKLLNGESINT